MISTATRNTLTGRYELFCMMILYLHPHHKPVASFTVCQLGGGGWEGEHQGNIKYVVWRRWGCCVFNPLWIFSLLRINFPESVWHNVVSSLTETLLKSNYARLLSQDKRGSIPPCLFSLHREMSYGKTAALVLIHISLECKWNVQKLIDTTVLLLLTHFILQYP